MAHYTLDRVATARNDLIRDVVAYNDAVARLNAAVTPANIRRHTETVAKSADMVDASAIELATAIAATQSADSSDLLSAVARAMGSRTSPTKASTSRANGSAPVKPGSRPRGRPRKAE